MSLPRDLRIEQSLAGRGADVEPLLNLGGYAGLGIERAFRDFDAEQRGVDAMLLSDDRRVLDLRNRDRLRQSSRQRPRQRPDRRQSLGFVANHLTVGRDRGFEHRLVGQQLRIGAGQARLGLGDVGAGHFADREPVPRLAQLFLQHIDVVAVEIDDGRVLQHIHVGLDARQKGCLLGVA